MALAQIVLRKQQKVGEYYAQRLKVLPEGSKDREKSLANTIRRPKYRAVDPGILEEKDRLEGILVVVLTGDSI